jgi:hypothetical protein
LDGLESIRERIAHTLFDDLFADSIQYLKFLDVQRERCLWEEELAAGLRRQPFLDWSWGSGRQPMMFQLENDESTRPEASRGRTD